MTAALIVCSGKTNHNTVFEPSRIIGSISAIERIVISLQQSGVERIAIVSDKDYKIKKIRTSVKLTYLTCPDHGEMFDSIKTGLSYLQDKCSQVLIIHVGVPMFSIHTIQLLMSSNAKICIPSYQGRSGHPILIHASCFDAIMNYCGNQGLKGAIEKSGVTKTVIDVDDKGILANIQRDQNLEQLFSGHDASKLRFSCQIQLEKEKIFYDASVHQLLELIEELGSLSKACSYMGISLNKGHTIISTMEQQLSFPILETKQGGTGGGYSRLTEQVTRLMKDYDQFCSESHAMMQELFKKHFIG